MARVRFQTFAERAAKLNRIVSMVTQMKALSGRAQGYYDFLRSLKLLTTDEFAAAYEDVNRILSEGPYMGERLAYIDGDEIRGLISGAEWYSFYPSPIRCGIEPCGGSAVWSNAWNPNMKHSYEVGVNYPWYWHFGSRYEVGGNLHSHSHAGMIVFRKTPIGTSMAQNHKNSPLSMLRVGDRFDITGSSVSGLTDDETLDGRFEVTEIVGVSGDSYGVSDNIVYMCGFRFEDAGVSNALSVETVAANANDTAMQISVRSGEMPRPEPSWVSSGNAASTGYIKVKL